MKGTDVNLFKRTAIDWAGRKGYTNIVELIKKHIKQQNIRKASLVTKKGTTTDGRPLVPHSQKDIASHIASFAGGKRKSKKSKKSKAKKPSQKRTTRKNKKNKK